MPVPSSPLSPPLILHLSLSLCPSFPIFRFSVCFVCVRRQVARSTCHGAKASLTPGTEIMTAKATSKRRTRAAAQRAAVLPPVPRYQRSFGLRYLPPPFPPVSRPTPRRPGEARAPRLFCLGTLPNREGMAGVVLPAAALHSRRPARVGNASGLGDCARSHRRASATGFLAPATASPLTAPDAPLAAHRAIAPKFVYWNVTRPCARLEESACAPQPSSAHFS